MSALFGLGGILLFALIGIFNSQLMEGMASIGIPGYYSLIAILVLACLSTLGAIGMWLGKKSGWWIGATYFVYVCLLSLQAVLQVPTLVEEFGEPERGVQYYYVQYIGRAIVHALLFLYFFKSNVTEYFQMGAVLWWKRLLVPILIAASIFGLFYVAMKIVLNG